MKDQKDPVDSILDTLRREPFSAQPVNPELEDRLMQAFDTQGTARRSRMGRVALIALAALTIGGGTFAATGGLQTLRSWLVTVEIDGKTQTLELTQVRDQELTLETEDGGTARINISRSATVGDDGMVEVSIERKRGEGEPAPNGTIKINLEPMEDHR